MTLSADIDFLGNLIDGLEDLNSGHRDTYDARLLTTYVRNETGVDFRFIGGLEDANDGEKKGVFGAIGAFFKKIFAFFFGKSEEQKRKEDEEKKKETERLIKEAEKEAKNIQIQEEQANAIKALEEKLTSQAEKHESDLVKAQKAFDSSMSPELKKLAEDAKKAGEVEKRTLDGIKELRAMLNKKEFKGSTVLTLLTDAGALYESSYQQMVKLRTEVNKMEANGGKGLHEAAKADQAHSFGGQYGDSKAKVTAELQINKSLLQLALERYKMAQSAYDNLYKLMTKISKGSDVKGKGNKGVYDDVNNALNDSTVKGHRTAYKKNQEDEAKRTSGNNSFLSLEDEINYQTRARRQGSRWY